MCQDVASQECDTTIKKGKVQNFSKVITKKKLSAVLIEVSIRAIYSLPGAWHFLLITCLKLVWNLNISNHSCVAVVLRVQCRKKYWKNSSVCVFLM